MTADGSQGRLISGEELDRLYGPLADELGQELLESFAPTAADTADRLLAALSDRETLRREAHTLKGTAGALGAVGLANLAATIEAGALDAPLEHLSALTETTCEQVRSLGQLRWSDVTK